MLRSGRRGALRSGSRLAGGLFYADRLARLRAFATSEQTLCIIRREAPEGADAFFRRLMRVAELWDISGCVRKHFAKEDISYIFEPLEIPDDLQRDPVYELWLDHMAEACKHFCHLLGKDELSFWFGANRGCTRYHVDAVPFRLLVTYTGRGTQWLPEDAAHRDVFNDMISPEKILTESAKLDHSEFNRRVVKDRRAIQYVKPWDVAVFKGGRDGVIHRTPDDAMDGASLLMRLDHPMFLNPEFFEGEEADAPSP